MLPSLFFCPSLSLSLDFVFFVKFPITADFRLELGYTYISRINTHGNTYTRATGKDRERKERKKKGHEGSNFTLITVQLLSLQDDVAFRGFP